jgi:hypothetical protein
MDILLLVYLATLSVTHTVRRRMAALVHHEFQNIWKQAVVALSEVLLRHLPGGTEGNREKISHDNRSAGRDLNPRYPKYEAGVLSTRPRLSV